MKKRELIKALKDLAVAHGVELELVREGSNHEIWEIGSLQFPIGRHAEIPEQTARGTIRAARNHLEKL
jgi:hypothetical protein